MWLILGFFLGIIYWEWYCTKKDRFKEDNK